MVSGQRLLTVYFLLFTNNNGDGTQTRDFIHVEDLCHAIHICLSALEKEQLTNQQMTNNGKISGEIFNLGAGKETSILALAKLIKELFHNEIEITFAHERKGEIKRNYSDITEARKIIGFNPQISLKDGVREVYEWFRTRNVVDVKNAQILSGSE